MAKQKRTPKSKAPKKKSPSRGIFRTDKQQIDNFQLSKEFEEYHKLVNTRQEIQGILFCALTLLLFFSLISYHAGISDQASPQNIAGVIGAFVSEFFFRYFGYVAYAFPIITLFIGLDKFRATPSMINYGNVFGVFVGILCLCALLSLPTLGDNTQYSPGGFVGVAVAAFLVSYLNLFGSIVVITTGIITSGALLKKYLFDSLLGTEGVVIRQEEPVESLPNILLPQKPEQMPKKEAKTSRKIKLPFSMPFKKKKPVKKPPQKVEAPPPPQQRSGYQLPSTALLHKPQPGKTPTESQQHLLNNSRLLEEKLLDFGVEGQVVSVLPGPVVTSYEFQPAPGIKVSRIINLADDLALVLKAGAVRIVAPVPGKDVVGIEVPNSHKETVYLREILESPIFLKHTSKLALGIGKDIGGRPYIADLVRMPHLLVAGATGSGKSVCLNALICSILFHATPHEVRFIMIDPKMLELSIYDGIPHLLIPVVKDHQHAVNALNWATEEMRRRYGILAKKGVRNIDQYNNAILDFRKHQHVEAGQTVVPTEDILPYIVIVVDELADLTIVSIGVEKPITRLAQMARAVGIHLLLATQRPSVDVITGVIKANFPARISFRVSSKVDSRTILDANGAETLLGEGDMLFLLPGTSRIRRLHGSFVSEKEIRRITSELKKMEQPQYDQKVLHYGEDQSAGEDDGVLYEQAAYLVVKSGEASVSLLRRNFNIGHSRAARLVDLMEKDGIVGPFRGSRPRDILVTPEQLDQRFGHDRLMTD